MNRLAAGCRILVSILREVFDESAYSRFLQRTHMTSSPTAYAAFWRERESGWSRRNRCC